MTSLSESGSLFLVGRGGSRDKEESGREISWVGSESLASVRLVLLIDRDASD